MQLLEMTWKEVEKYLESRRAIIIPFGSIEQHGHAMPIGTDTYIAERISSEVGKKTFTLVTPCLMPALSLVPHMAFPGTISLRPDTLQRVIEDTIKSLYKHGFRQFLLINSHRLNDTSIGAAFQNLCYELEDIRFNSRSWWDLKKVRNLRKVYFTNSGHATSEEASMMLYIHEKLVKKNAFTKHNLPYNYFTSIEQARAYTSTGLINGDQGEADEGLGRQMFNEAVQGYIQLLNELITQ